MNSPPPTPPTYWKVACRRLWRVTRQPHIFAQRRFPSKSCKRTCIMIKVTCDVGELSERPRGIPMDTRSQNIHNTVLTILLTPPHSSRVPPSPQSRSSSSLSSSSSSSSSPSPSPTPSHHHQHLRRTVSRMPRASRRAGGGRRAGQFRQSWKQRAAQERAASRRSNAV